MLSQGSPMISVECLTLSITGIIIAGHYIPPFREDHKLSQNELAFLRAFKTYMDNIRDRLLEETDQLKRGINKYEYDNIISDTIFKSMEGSYPLFLDEYIDYGSEE